MAFHKSSKNIIVTDGNLCATCKDCGGRDRTSELRLDDYLGNRNGFFEWGGGGFSRSARDIRLTDEEGSMYLYASLRTQHKSWREARVNLSDKITNCNGVLQYLGGAEPHVEYSRGFLGEERDFLSAAISDTISDLRELFSGPSLFDELMSDGQSNRARYVPREYPEPSGRERSTTTEDPEASIRDSGRESCAASAQPSTEKTKEQPPAYDFKGAMGRSASLENQTRPDKSKTPGASNEDSRIPDTPSQRDIEYCSEDIARQHINEFLLSGHGGSVYASKSENGERILELREGDSVVKTMQIQNNTFFDQDKARRGSVSEASIMTPSVVDGEEEYDFLD